MLSLGTMPAAEPPVFCNKHGPGTGMLANSILHWEWPARPHLQFAMGPQNVLELYKN